MQPHPHTVFVNRPARRRSRMPQLLFGSTSLGAMLLAALSVLGRWEAGAGPAAPPTVAASAEVPREQSSIPAASEVLRDAPPVPDEAVSSIF